MRLTLVFGDNDTKFTANIDGTPQTGSNHMLTVDIEAGEHEIKKKDTTNLFYIGLKAL